MGLLIGDGLQSTVFCLLDITPQFPVPGEDFSFSREAAEAPDRGAVRHISQRIAFCCCIFSG